MKLNEFTDLLDQHHYPYTKHQIDCMLQYASLLKQWNEKMNLTAIVELEEVMDKHMMDSLYPIMDYPLSGNVADVGSGAGFPGLVWAIFNPDVNFDLIEPTGKRCTFLNEVINQLQLTNVTVINRRAEDLNEYKGHYDVVTARAVASLPILLELCIPLVKKGGNFVALKGSQADSEVSLAANALKQLNSQVTHKVTYTCEDGGNHITLFIQSNGCDSKYPRNYSQIKKKPL